MGFPSATANSLDQQPLGAIVQSAINLELVNLNANGLPRWMQLNGGDSLVSILDPSLQRIWPNGVFTATARTLNAIPVVATIAADSTNFLAPGAAGTSPLQASPDAITWSTSATWAAATSPASIIVSGTRYVMAGSGGDLTAPYVSTTGQTAANQVNKSNWTVTTGGFTTSLKQGLAYSPSLGLTVGVTGSADTSFFTLADGATAWTTRTGTSATKKGICWDGQYFIAITSTAGMIQRSSDGTNWSDVYTGNFGDSYNSIASDGNGTTVVTSSAYSWQGSVIISKDGSATWQKIVLPVEVAVGLQGSIYDIGQGSVQYINGKFIFGGDNPTNNLHSALISKTGDFWIYEQLGKRGIPYTRFRSLAVHPRVCGEHRTYC